MLEIKIYLALKLTLARLTFGLFVPFSNIKKLVVHLKSEKHIRRLIRAMFSEAQPTLRKIEYANMFSHDRCIPKMKYKIFVDVLLEKERINYYCNTETLVNIIEAHNTPASYTQPRAVTRRDYILGFDGNLNKIITFERFAYGLLRKDSVKKHLLQATIYSLCNELNFSLDDIQSILKGKNGEFLHRHHSELEKRFIYLICRYGESKDMMTLAKNRPDLQQEISRNVDQNSRRKKPKYKKPKKPWQVR